MRRVLLIADADDRLAVALRGRLRAAVSLPARSTFPQSHFTIENDGTVVDSAVLLEDRWVGFSKLAGVLFRPGRTWKSPGVAANLRQAFNRHERRAAWSAWLAALPCPVANRLAPAWFLAPDLHGQALGRSLASAAGLGAARGGPRRRGEAARRAYFVGAEFLSATGEAALHLSPGCSERVERWCSSTGILFGAVELVEQADGLQVESVQPVPTLTSVSDAGVGRLCRLLASRLA